MIESNTCCFNNFIAILSREITQLNTKGSKVKANVSGRYLSYNRC